MRHQAAFLFLFAAIGFAGPAGRAAAQDEGAAAPGAEPAADALAALAAAEARWAEAQDGSYRYGYRKHCDCYRDEPPLTVVTVENDVITDVFHVHSDSPREVPAREGSFDLYWTVDDLFERLANALGRGAVVRAEYDASAGFPASLYIDYDTDLIGDETDLRLTRFERLE